MTDLYHMLDPAEAAFIAMLERFASEDLAPKAAAADESGLFVHDQLRALAATGMMGANLPESWGGGGGLRVHRFGTDSALPGHRFHPAGRG